MTVRPGRAATGRALACVAMLVLASGCATAEGPDSAAPAGVAGIGTDATRGDVARADDFAAAVRSAVPPGTSVTVEVLDGYRSETPSGPEGTLAEGRYLVEVDGVRGSLDYQVTESIRPALPASAVVVRESLGNNGSRATLVHVEGISAAVVVAHPDGRHVQTILTGDGPGDAAPLTDDQLLALSHTDVFLT